MTLRGVIFDYGGVLTTPVRHSIAAWLDRERIAPSSFTAALRDWLSRSAPSGTPIHELEKGTIAPAEFESLIAARLSRTDGAPVDPVGLLEGLFAGLRPDQQMYGLVEDLRDTGVRVALLSNSWGNTYPRPRIEALFDPVLISGEIGLRKPDPAIYRHALELLDLPAEQVAFVDDAQPNIDGARAVGMHSDLHLDAGATRRHFAGLVPGLSPIPREAGNHV